MTELHCWVTIREHYCLDDDNLELIVQKINKRIEKYSFDFKVKSMNGEYYLEYSLFSNHFSQDANELLNLFSYIGEVAIGSYGLLYLHDDEDIEKHNYFKVYKLAKGIIYEIEDNYLSPCIPTIEEELNNTTK